MGFKETNDSQSESVIDFNSIQSLFRNGDYKLPELYCVELLKRDPTNVLALLMLSSIQFKLKCYDKSEHYILLAITHSPLMAEAYSNLGNIYRARGKLQEALDNYRHALLLKPDFKDGYINLAGALIEAGQVEQAIQAYVTVLQLEPNLYSVRIDLGNLLKSVNRLQEAKFSYFKALEVQPRSAVAWNNLGSIYNIQGEVWLAIDHFMKAVFFDPDYLEAYVNLGDTFNKSKIYEKATIAYLRAIVLFPNDAYVYVNLGISYAGQGMYDLSINSYRRAIELQPDYTDAYCNLGLALHSKGMLEEASSSFYKALHFNPSHIDTLNNLAILKMEQGYLDHAISLLKKILEVEPNFVSAHNNIGVILQKQGKFSDSIVYFKEAINIDPLFADVYNNLGETLKEMNALEGALECFQKALSINPSYGEAHCNIASLYKDSSKNSEAIQSYKFALQLKPYFPNAFCNLTYCSLTICDWTDYDSRLNECVRMVVEQLQNNTTPSIHPHHAMLFPLTWEHKKAIATSFAKFYEDKVKFHQKLPFTFKRELTGRLRVGYVSSDFGNHPTSHLMQSIPGLHNKTKVEIFCYALSKDDKTTFRAKISNEAEHFVDLSTISCDEEVADLIYKDGIHILVNLNGYTRGARSEIFAFQPAPIQVMWLGYPDTSGAQYMDYIITDTITSPMELSMMYSEKLAYMPHTYFIGDHQQMFPHLQQRLIFNNKCQANLFVDNISVINGTNLSLAIHPFQKREHISDSSQPGHTPSKIAKLSKIFSIDDMITNDEKRTYFNGVVIQNGTELDKKVAFGEEAPQNVVITSRQEYGLPSDAVIFCNFNQLYKLDPYTFSVWVHIIKNVENSVLWLLKFPPEGVKNILAEAHRLELPAERIVFSDVAPKEEHVRRGQLADICLDTPICNGHTTTMDVLWGGTPVVTLPGTTMASRVAASILCALGCPELVAQSCQQYRDIAIRLGNDSNYLQIIRAKVWHMRGMSTLFNCRKYAEDIEGLYMRMWERFSHHENPDHLLHYVDSAIEEM